MIVKYFFDSLVIGLSQKIERSSNVTIITEAFCFIVLNCKK